MAFTAWAIVTIEIAVARPIFAIAIFPRSILSRSVFPGTLIALAIPAFTALGFDLDGFAGRLALAAAFVLEVDIIARGEGVAADDVAGRTLRLHGAQDAKIVFGVLLVAFSQHPVAGGQRVPGELLILFEHMLSRTADFDAIRSIGLERPVRVVLGFAAVSGAPIAAALPLHTFEISHVFQ
jgi:hypothetical protein